MDDKNNSSDEGYDSPTSETEVKYDPTRTRASGLRYRLRSDYQTFAATNSASLGRCGSNKPTSPRIPHLTPRARSPTRYTSQFLRNKCLGEPRPTRPTDYASCNKYYEPCRRPCTIPRLREAAPPRTNPICNCETCHRCDYKDSHRCDYNDSYRCDCNDSHRCDCNRRNRCNCDTGHGCNRDTFHMCNYNTYEPCRSCGPTTRVEHLTWGCPERSHCQYLDNPSRRYEYCHPRKGFIPPREDFEAFQSFVNLRQQKSSNADGGRSDSPITTREDPYQHSLRPNARPSIKDIYIEFLKWKERNNSTLHADRRNECSPDEVCSNQVPNSNSKPTVGVEDKQKETATPRKDSDEKVQPVPVVKIDLIDELPVGLHTANKEALQPFEESEGEMVPCNICGRKFRSSRIMQHQRICAKAYKEPKPFTPRERSTCPAPGAAPKPKFQGRTPDELIAIAEKTFVDCPYCARTFGPASYERHLEVCKACFDRNPEKRLKYKQQYLDQKVQGLARTTKPSSPSTNNNDCKPDTSPKGNAPSPTPSPAPTVKKCETTKLKRKEKTVSSSIPPPPAVAVNKDTKRRVPAPVPRATAPAPVPRKPYKPVPVDYSKLIKCPKCGRSFGAWSATSHLKSCTATESAIRSKPSNVHKTKSTPAANDMTSGRPSTSSGAIPSAANNLPKLNKPEMKTNKKNLKTGGKPRSGTARGSAAETKCKPPTVGNDETMYQYSEESCIESHQYQPVLYTSESCEVIECTQENVTIRRYIKRRTQKNKH